MINVKDTLLSYIVNEGFAENKDILEKSKKAEHSLDELRDGINVYTFIIEENIFNKYYKTCSRVYFKIAQMPHKKYDKNQEMTNIINQYEELILEMRTHLKKESEMN